MLFRVQRLYTAALVPKGFYPLPPLNYVDLAEGLINNFVTTTETQLQAKPRSQSS